ncbi:ATAD2 protein, partial [Eudromia elegans]|nr:ATAD2 protein [Eudromia elegans]
RFDGVGGLSEHIAALKEMVILPLLYPEVFEKLKVQPPRGCLFYGPPGTGKTLVARALASECSQGARKISFFLRKGADALSKWVGESERQLRLLFEQYYFYFILFCPLLPLALEHCCSLSQRLRTLDLGVEILDVCWGRINKQTNKQKSSQTKIAVTLCKFSVRMFAFKLHAKSLHVALWKLDFSVLPETDRTFNVMLFLLGYCGADIKAACAEAALRALRRRYPQIYKSTEKLQLDASSIKVTAKDFFMAMEKMVPASQRSVSSPAQALSPIFKPLLNKTLKRILQALQRVFPHAELVLKKDQQQGMAITHDTNSMLESDFSCSDEESLSGFDDKDTSPKRSHGKKKKFLDFKRNAYEQPTSHRPRLLLSGEPDSGQCSHLAPAVLHALEKLPVYTLHLSVLFPSASTPEETCAQFMRDAQRTAPSIIYIPQINVWWESAGVALKTTFTTLLENIPPFAPVLLFATSNVPYMDLQNEV